jgi:hypothetical protein
MILLIPQRMRRTAPSPTLALARQRRRRAVRPFPCLNEQSFQPVVVLPLSVVAASTS